MASFLPPLSALVLALVAAAPGAGSARQPAAQRDRIRACLDRGDWALAESLSWRLTSDSTSNPGPDSLDYSQSLDLLLESLVLDGHAHRPDAQALALAAIRIRERKLGAQAPELVRPLMRLGEVLEDEEGHPPIPAFERAVRIAQARTPPDSLLIADAENQLGLAHYTFGDVDAAESLFSAACGVRRRHLPAPHPDLAGSLVSVSMTTWDRGRTEEALRLLREAVAMFEQTLGPDHPRLIRPLTILGLRLRFVQRQPEAQKAFDRAIALGERRLRPNHPYLAEAFRFAAANLDELDEFVTGGQYIERAVAMMQEDRPPGDLETAMATADLGGWHLANGDLSKGRDMLEHAVAIFRASGRSGDLRLGIALRLLGPALVQTAEYERARQLLQESESIYARQFGEGNPDLIWARMLLSFADLANGDAEPARARLNRLIPLASAAEAGDGRLTSYCVELLGAADAEQRRWPDARREFARCREIRARKLGPGRAETIMAQMEQARCEIALGQPASAVKLLAGAFAASDTSLVLKGWVGPRVELMLADALNRQGRPRAALAEALASERDFNRLLDDDLAYLPEDRALRLADASYAASGVMLSIAAHLRGLSAQDRRRIYDLVVHSRGQVVDQMSVRVNGGHRGHDPARVALEARRAAVCQRLANLEVRMSRETDPGLAGRIQAARAERDEVEARLRLLAPGPDAPDRVAAIGERRIAEALPSGGALVSYVCYGSARVAENCTLSDVRLHGRGGSAYLAFVLRAGDPTPTLFPLGSAAHIDSLVSEFAREVSRPVPANRASAANFERDYRTAGRRMREAVWDPLRTGLAGARTVLVVPDGALHAVNFSTLPEGDGYLAENDPLLCTLTTERDLVTSRRTPPPGSGLLALGGPDFDADPRLAAGVPSAAASSGAPAAYSHEDGSTRLRKVSCEGFRTVRFPPLPGAREEVDGIARIWGLRSTRSAAARREESMVLLQGPTASEATFKALAPGRRIIHLATHGFLYAGGCSSGWPGLRGIGELSPSPGAARKAAPGRAEAPGDPLLLSGLALAGANRRQEAGLDEDDGILTAEEISALDLSGAEWAVVSACESGAGAVLNGEGVFGLRRAFQMAGVRTTILSLWPVQDQAARAWVEALYRARFLRGLGSAAAVREASRSVLRERRARGVSTHPFFWGSFVESGDWR